MATQSQWRRLRIPLLVVAAAALVLLAVPEALRLSRVVGRAWGPASAPRVAGPGQTFIRWVDLGVPAPGIRVAEVSQPTMPETRFLVVQHAGGTFTLERCEQMVGLVRIGTAQHARAWARFAAGPFSQMAGRSEFEIAPLVGSPRWHPQTSGEPSRYGKRKRTYTTYGELTARDMRAGGFEPPTAAGGPNGFVVTRWVYVPGFGPRTGRVERLVELVSPNGAVRRTVTAEKVAPPLPEGEWGVLYAKM